MEVGEKVATTTAQNNGETVQTAQKAFPKFVEGEGEITNSLAAGEVARAVHFWK